MNDVLGTLGRSLRRSWDEGVRTERVAFVVGGLLVLSGLVHLVVLTVSGGTWTGPVSLRKPTTFGLSFGLTLATVAWVTHFIRMTPRGRRVLLTVFTVACVVETTLVSVQAWRGVPSHFNFSTGVNAAISGTLAFGGMVIVATAVAMTMTTFRAMAKATPSMRLAVRFGFVTLLVALGVGAAMIATGTTAAQSDPELAYTTAGFLKPAHAVFMHAVLVIPGLGWLLGFTSWAERFRLQVVRLGAGGYLLVGIVVLVESITRVPPLAAPLPAMLASGAGLALLLAAGGIGIYGVLFRRPNGTAATPGAVRSASGVGQIN
jgi:hypothetical protein